MKKHLLTLFLFIGFCHSSVFSQVLSHPGGMHTKAQLSASFNNEAYNTMMISANAALSNTHHAIADFSVPGAYINGDQHVKMSKALQDDTREAYACALAFSLNGDSKYAEKALYFLMAWANTNTKYSDFDGPLVMAYSGTAMVIAADILWPYKEWSSADRTQFKDWVKNVYYHAGKSIYNKTNNWADWGTYACLLSTHFLDDKPAFDTYKEHVKFIIDNQINDKGEMPHEHSRGGSALTSLILPWHL